MNKEEIEELKDFTIDLTDIDELALGLEVCSKKSNMVIQEFADTIIQLQQENQELKKQLEEENEKIILLQASEPMLNYKKALEENQQKEFIEYMNKTIEELECDDGNDDVMNVCVLGSIVYDNKEIKAVITHEQMEQMAYKVGIKDE